MARARLSRHSCERAGDRVQYRQPVEGVVGFGIARQNVPELLARILVVAGIQQGDGVVVVLLWA